MVFNCFKTLHTLVNKASIETIKLSLFGLTIVGPQNLLLLNTVQNLSGSTIDITLYGNMQCSTLIKYAKPSTIKPL